MNKKGQVESIIIFIGVVIGIFVLSIIVLRMSNEILTPFSTQLATINNQSATTVNEVRQNFAIVWDWVIILLFLFNVVILLYSSFMVDIHPAFLLIYIIAVMFLVIFTNTFGFVIDSVWDKVGTATETTQTTKQQFIINNFNLIMVAIIFLSGVVMYAKFKYFNGVGTGGNY